MYFLVFKPVKNSKISFNVYISVMLCHVHHVTIMHMHGTYNINNNRLHAIGTVGVYSRPHIYVCVCVYL